MIKIDFKEFFNTRGIFGFYIMPIRIYNSRSQDSTYRWKETWWIGRRNSVGKWNLICTTERKWDT